MLMLGVLDAIPLKRFGCERVRISNLQCGGKREGQRRIQRGVIQAGNCKLEIEN
jgi:hypothetical protein